MLKITYNNSNHQDGGCAQVQRIIGIFCIARHLNIEYIHSELNDIEHRYRDNIDYLPIYNKFFHFENHRKINDLDFTKTKIIECDRISKKIIDENRNKDVLIKILYPYDITDIYPKLYNYIYEYSFVNKPLYDDIFRVCIHIRRGDVNMYKNTERFLSDEYYLDKINKISQILFSKNKKFIINIYSENSNTYNFNKFKNLNNVELKIDYDDVETIKELAMSNILIMSKSSYSYVAGLLNKDGLVIYPDGFWHTKMEKWITSDNISYIEELV
jgi:hypothetical protein